MTDTIFELPYERPVGEPPAGKHTVEQLEQTVTACQIRLINVKRFPEKRTAPENREISPIFSLLHSYSAFPRASLNINGHADNPVLRAVHLSASMVAGLCASTLESCVRKAARAGSSTIRFSAGEAGLAGLFHSFGSLPRRRGSDVLSAALRVNVAQRALPIDR